MTEIQQKMMETFQETVSFYEEDPSRRSIDDKGNCLYFHGTDRCAVGRLLPEDYEEVFRKDNYQNGNVDNLFHHYPEIKESLDYPLWFLRALQDFHDDPSYWEDCGSSETTKAYRAEKVEDIKRRIKSDDYYIYE